MYIIASRMPAPPSQNPSVFTFFQKKCRQLHTFEPTPLPDPFGAPPLGPSQNLQKPMVFHTFRSVPPKALESECDPHFCLPRPSPGPFQKCIQYYVFDQFRSWVPLGTILLFSDSHLAPSGGPLIFLGPPRSPQRSPRASHGRPLGLFY